MPLRPLLGALGLLGASLALTAAPAAAQAAGAPAASPSPTASAPALPAAPRVRGLVQTWYVFDEATPDTFRLRRVNVWVSGQVTPELSYNLMFNPLRPLALPAVVADPNAASGFVTRSGGDDRILQDAFVRAAWGDWNVMVGQFKLPMSAEALEPAAELLTLRRALFNESTTQIGFYRDLGAQVGGKLYPGFDAVLGVFNGEGQNVLDRNHNKDVAGRLTFSGVPGVKLGLSHLRGMAGANPVPRERTGVNAEWAAGPVLLRAEALAGQDGARSELGWYGQASGFVWPGWQALVRYEGWNPDRLKQPADERDWTLGLSYHFTPPNPSKATVNYIHQTMPDGTLNHTGILGWQLML